MFPRKRYLITFQYSQGSASTHVVLRHRGKITAAEINKAIDEAKKTNNIVGDVVTTNLIEMN